MIPDGIKHLISDNYIVQGQGDGKQMYKIIYMALGIMKAYTKQGCYNS